MVHCPTPVRVATLACCLMLGGCSVFGDWWGSEKTNYEGQSKRTLAGIIFGVGMAIGAVNFMAWLFP